MRISRRSVVDIVLLVLVNGMWAAQYAAYKVVTRKMGPVTVGAWTFLMASVALLPFLIRERWQSEVTPEQTDDPASAEKRVSRSPLTRRNLVSFLVVGVVGLIPTSVFLAWGVDRSTASNAAIIYLTLPIITAVLASIILAEKMTLVRWGSLGIALAGVTILSSSDVRHLQLVHSKYLLGNVLVLLACATSAFYNVYCKELLRRFTPLEVLVYGYLIAFVFSLPLLRWAEPLSAAAVRSYDPSTWLALVVLSVISWGLAMVLWMFLLKRLDVSQASVSIYLLPFLGVLISAVTLGERITPRVIAGGLVTLVGTALITSLEPSAG